MATITAALVKELREETGVGMMECKKALVEANGDKAAAVKILREAGMAIAAKKASRTAKQGIIAAEVSADGKTGRMVEINCETDFVAKNDGFKAFVGELLADAAGVEDNGLAAAQKAKIDAKIAEIGENIVARRNISYEVSGNGAIAAYVHMGGKFGVLVEVGFEKPETAAHPAAKSLLSNIVLHICAENPVAIDRSGVPAETVAAESEIYRKQVEGKPANIIDKIVAGKLEKFYSQICLLEQEYFSDADKRVSQVLAEAGKEAGDTFSIRRFTRWQLGA